MNPLGVEVEILEALRAARTPFWTDVLFAVTVFGRGWVTAVLCTFVVVLLMLKREWRAAAFLGLANLGTAFLNPALKTLFARARPESELASSLLAPSSFSLPSGHAMSAMVFYTSLVMVVHHVAPRWQAPVVVLAAVMIPLMGFTRIYLGVHYPSDILVGWVVGAAWVWLAYYFFLSFLRSQSYEKSRKKPLRRNS